LATPIAAHQPVDGDIYSSFGAITYMTHNLDHSFDNPPLVSPGIVVEGDLTNHGGIEVSFFYLRNAFSLRRDHKTLVERVKRLYISTGYRHWFTQKFSAAGALFSTYTIGDAKVIHDEFPTGEAPNTSARDTSKYGLDFSVQYEPLRIDRFSLIVDGRYAYSFTAKPNEDSNHFGIFVAIKYFIQSRQRSTDSVAQFKEP
jgi:hypothetical protein